MPGGWGIRSRERPVRIRGTGEARGSAEPFGAVSGRRATAARTLRRIVARPAVPVLPPDRPDEPRLRLRGLLAVSRLHEGRLRFLGHGEAGGRGAHRAEAAGHVLPEAAEVAVEAIARAGGGVEVAVPDDRFLGVEPVRGAEPGDERDERVELGLGGELVDVRALRLDAQRAAVVPGDVGAHRELALLDGGQGAVAALEDVPAPADREVLPDVVPAVAPHVVALDGPGEPERRFEAGVAGVRGGGVVDDDPVRRMVGHRRLAPGWRRVPLAPGVDAGPARPPGPDGGGEDLGCEENGPGDTAP